MPQSTKSPQASCCIAKKSQIDFCRIFCAPGVNSRTSSFTRMISYDQKIRWNQTISLFLNTWIWTLRFEISLSLEHSHKINLVDPFCHSSRVCAWACVRACVPTECWCLIALWTIESLGIKVFQLAREFLNCQINWFLTHLLKRLLSVWLWANSPGDHIKWGGKNVPLGDIPCEVCAVIMNTDAHVLNICYFLTNDVLCCHLNPREAE